MKAKAHRIVGLVGAGLATAVMLAGSVQAAERPDDRAGLLGVGGAQVVTVAPDAVDRAVLRHATESAVVPDAFERAAARGVTPVPDALDRAVLRETGASVRPDDRGEARGPGIAPSGVTAGASASDDGFAWGDAFFGAAVALFIVLLGGATALTIRHRGRVILP
jgi:hypothetical protein